MLRHQRESGDTIIEVLLAVTVFSMVAIGALTIMNQGVAAAQRSLEITLVRQQMDAQAEALRLLHGAYLAAPTSTTDPMVDKWRQIRDSIAQVDRSSLVEFGALSADGRCLTGSIDNAFVVDPVTLAINNDAGLVEAAETFAQLRHDPAGIQQVEAKGLWVQALRVARVENKPGYVDFHIRGCWDASGTSVPMTLGTIVRLYDPQS